MVNGPFEIERGPCCVPPARDYIDETVISDGEMVVFFESHFDISRTPLTVFGK
jgi:hypothetical protein